MNLQECASVSPSAFAWRFEGGDAEGGVEDVEMTVGCVGMKITAVARAHSSSLLNRVHRVIASPWGADTSRRVVRVTVALLVDIDCSECGYRGEFVLADECWRGVGGDEV